MDKIQEVLTRGVDKIYPSKEVFEKVLRSGKKLRLYQGFDPTGTKLHIGHMIGLMKLRQFQHLGHKVIFLIGDFTGMIGDPTGKSESRKPLTREQVAKNAQDYKNQVSAILSFTGENPVEIKYNSEWLEKFNATEFLYLASHVTYQQIVERDLFQERKKKGLDVNMTEFLYPIMQGYDSIALDVDLEIGGSDQTFNMLIGRDLMHKLKKKEKYVLTTPLLTDSEGRKIGKTEGNVIGLTDEPKDFYGKIMSLSDDVIIKAFEYLTEIPMREVETMQKELKSGANPIIYKKKLAFTLTKMLNSEKDAQEAQIHFEQTVQKHETPADLSEYSLAGKNTDIISILVDSKSVTSRSEAKRLIEGNAIELDNKTITDLKSVVKPGILKVGKRRFLKII